MNYLVRSVNQMSAVEVQQYVDLFNKTFDKELTIAEFYYKFSRQFGDTAYLSLMVDEHSGIVGAVGAIEVPYTWRGQRFTFGLTVDGMIDARYRNNFLALKRLHDLLTNEISNRKFSFIFTKPNQNSYLYLKKLLGLIDLGHLNVYAFPIRLFRLVYRRLGWLDMPWSAAINIISSYNAPFKEVSLQEIEDIIGRIPPEPRSYAHRVRDANFFRRRYGSPAYGHAAMSDKFVIYGIRRFGGRYACFIMEAFPLTTMEWMTFAGYVAGRHPCVDVMLQVDSERRHFSPFVKLPRWLLPDKLNIVGKVLDPSTVPADVTFSMRLSDFEVV